MNVSICTDASTSTFTVPAGLISDARTNLTEAVVQVVGEVIVASSTGTSTGSATTVTTTTTVTSTGTGVSESIKEKYENLGIEAAIGAGVGVPLLLALVGMVFMYLRERRLRMAMMGVAQDLPDGGMGAGNGYYDTPRLTKAPMYEAYVQPHEMMSEGRPELSS